MARYVRRRRLLLDAAGMESNRSAADLLADVRGQAAALDPGRTAQGRANLQPEAEEPLPSRAADAAGGLARPRRQQLRHLDADASCGAPPGGTDDLCGVGHPPPRRRKRQAADKTHA